MEEYRKEINRKQDLAILIESIYLLKSYSVKSNGCRDFWNLEPKKGCLIDVANQTYIRLIDQMLDELRKIDFIIYLDEYSEIKVLYKSMQQFEEVDPFRNREISKMYDNMSISFDYLKKIMESCQINFIELLINHGQYDVIVELLLSSKNG